MLSKVFLQHLGPLSSLPTFTALWLTILDLVGQFCATASTDILADALPESLKNMLLVMDTSGRGLFFSETGHPTPLWGVTWGKIDTFLPGLRVELFPDWEKRPEAAAKKAAQEAGTSVESDAAEVAATTVESGATDSAVDTAVTDTAAEVTIEQVVQQEPPVDDKTSQEPVASTADTEVTVPPAAEQPQPPTTPCLTAAAPHSALSAPAPVLGSLTTTAPPSLTTTA